MQALSSESGHCRTTNGVADFGVEHAVPINGLDSNAIASKLEHLVKKGENMPSNESLCMYV